MQNTVCGTFRFPHENVDMKGGSGDADGVGKDESGNRHAARARAHKGCLQRPPEPGVTAALENRGWALMLADQRAPTGPEEKP